MENNFVHLNLHTEYSLSEGVNSIDNFLIKAKELGMTSLAVTDYANMFCAVEFYQKAKKMGIKPIIGLELPIFNKDEQNIFSLTLLAKNYNGYKNLVKLASELYKKNENRELKLNKEILKEYSQDLIALSSSINGEIGKAILTNSCFLTPTTSANDPNTPKNSSPSPASTLTACPKTTKTTTACFSSAPTTKSALPTSAPFTKPPNSSICPSISASPPKIWTKPVPNWS